MRTIRFVPLLAVLVATAALAACSELVQPSQRNSAEIAPRFDSGIYMGTGHAVVSPNPATLTVDSSAVGRGSGYLGNGY